MRIRNPLFVFLALCLSLISPPGCSLFRSSPGTPSPVESATDTVRDIVPGLSKNDTDSSNPQYETEEDLLKIVAEFQRVEATDTYRFPLPQDATGANAYKATLKRLDDYEAKHPGVYPILVAYTKARAYEGLHAYEPALEHYQTISHSSHRLKEEGTKAVAALSSFQELTQRPFTATTPVAYLKALDEQAAAWHALSQQQAGTRYETLALEEEERLDMAKVTFLNLNRHQIQDGTESVIAAFGQLLDKHSESKNRYRYRIELGDFYFSLTKEYVYQHDPESLTFSASLFEQLGQAALTEYAQVAQEDGVLEKLEAKGKLEALEAYMAKIGRLGR